MPHWEFKVNVMIINLSEWGTAPKVSLYVLFIYNHIYRTHLEWLRNVRKLEPDYGFVSRVLTFFTFKITLQYIYRLRCI